MLRITIELVPGGDESRARELARAEVTNIDAMPRMMHSDYAVTVSEGDNKHAGTKAWSCNGTLFEQPKSGKSVWALAAAVARFAIGESENEAAARLAAEEAEKS